MSNDDSSAKGFLEIFCMVLVAAERSLFLKYVRPEESCNNMKSCSFVNEEQAE